jgi:DNA repair photolyase
MDQALPRRPRKGRGAVGNPTGRYESHVRFAVDDGWHRGDDNLPPLRTVVGEDRARTAITTNTSPDLPFDRSINPYQGCEHGCVYCYARPSHARLGLSPGLDFESRLFAKSDAPAALERQLRRPGYRCKTILLGANTDPYQPVERRRELTRRILRVLKDFNHPVAIATKSNLVLRDIDILASMAARGLASVGISVTTLSRGLARRLEPRAPTPARRLEAIRRLAAAAVPTAVMAAPMIPALNDAELEAILEAAAEAGAVAATTILVRLPLELKALFSEWLEAHAPDKAGHVLSLIRQSRGGALYDSRFGARMRGTGPYAELLAHRFRLACKRLGLAEAGAAGFALDAGRFRPPPGTGDQLRLL